MNFIHVPIPPPHQRKPLLALKRQDFTKIPDAPAFPSPKGRASGRRGPRAPVIAPGTARLPVGSGDRRDRPGVGQMPSVSTVLDMVTTQRQIALLKASAGRNKPSNQRVVSFPPVTTKKVPRVSSQYPGIPPRRTDNRTIEINKGGGNVALDLGNLLGTLGGKYIDARWGGPVSGPAFRPTVQPWNTPGNFPEGGARIPPTGVGTVLDPELPFYDVIPETSTKGMCWDPSADCGRGKWIRRSRRRRKRLATGSDIKDLAALSSVTTGQEKKTWIATHPS